MRRRVAAHLNNVNVLINGLLGAGLILIEELFAHIVHRLFGNHLFQTDALGKQTVSRFLRPFRRMPLLIVKRLLLDYNTSVPQLPRLLDSATSASGAFIKQQGSKASSRFTHVSS